MVVNKKALRGEAQEQEEDLSYEDDYDDDEDRYIPPYRHRGRQLRNRNIPYYYEVTDDMIFETLDTEFPLGLLKSTSGKGEELVFGNIKHAGSYQWEGMPLMRDQLGVDHKVYRLPGQRSFITPAVPDILGDPTMVGRLDSDLKSGFIDYIIDAKDASFLRPTFSPFEPVFRSLSTSIADGNSGLGSTLDSIDLIADHTTLLHIIQFLQDPPSSYIRTDCQFTHPNGPVVMHRWLAKVLYGAGEPHRGHVNSYTRRVTERAMGESWKGETTQVVRYDLGGMGMMIRYPVSARLSGDDKLKEGSRTQYTLNTGNKIVTKTKVVSSTGPPTAEFDRSQLVVIKAISQHPYHPGIRASDMQNLYLRLILTQTTQCLIAPHFRGDFGQPDYPPRMITIDDPILDETRAIMDPLINQAMRIWRSMVLITRHYGKNVSFVGNEDGSMSVMSMKRGVYEHVGLSEKILGKMGNAKPPGMKQDQINGYYEYDRTMHTKDWAFLNHSGDPSTVRWK